MYVERKEREIEKEREREREKKREKERKNIYKIDIQRDTSYISDKYLTMCILS